MLSQPTLLQINIDLKKIMQYFVQHFILYLPRTHHLMLPKKILLTLKLNGNNTWNTLIGGMRNESIVKCNHATLCVAQRVSAYNE